MPIIISWFAWKARNDSKHENRPIEARAIILRVLHYFKLGHSSLVMNQAQWKGDTKVADLWHISISPKVTKPLILVYWERPQSPWVKINTDATIIANPSFAGLGGIIRDENGRFLAAFQNFLPNLSIFEAELQAVVSGLTLAIATGHTHIIVESDSRGIIDLINNQSNHVNWKWWKYLYSLATMSTGLNVTYKHICREGNSVADALADEAILQKMNRFPTLSMCNRLVKKAIYSDNCGLPYLRIPT